MAPPPDQLVLLAQTEEGYANLLKLVSKSYLATDSSDAPQISLADFTDLNAGLIALTGGPAGPVGRLLADGRSEEHKSELQSLMRISYAVFLLKKKNIHHTQNDTTQ